AIPWMPSLMPFRARLYSRSRIGSAAITPPLNAWVTMVRLRPQVLQNFDPSAAAVEHVGQNIYRTPYRQSDQKQGLSNKIYWGGELIQGLGLSIARKVDGLYTISLDSNKLGIRGGFLPVKNSLLTACILALFCASMGPVSGLARAGHGRDETRQENGLGLPAVKRDWLLNGLQLILIEQQGTGRVRVHLRINSGAMFDLAAKGGLADI